MKIRALFLGLLLAVGTAGAQDLTLSAAASLTDVLLRLQDDAQQSVGVKIFLNMGGSGTLRRQIEQGAPVDLFFSAAREDMDKLQKQGLIVGETRQDLLRNSLVMIADPSVRTAGDLESLVSSVRVVAIGNPETVPAGRYAVEALKKFGLYDIARPKLAYGGSVREVLQYVQSGSAPLGLVFLTDLLSAQPPGSVVRIYRFPADTFAEPIIYPIAVTSSSPNRLRAESLIRFFRSEKARAVFTTAGFELP